MIKNLDAIQNIFLSRFKNFSGKSATHLIDYTATPNWHETSFNAFVLTYTCNGSPSKNPDIKTPLVASFSLEFVIHFSSIAACWLCNKLILVSAASESMNWVFQFFWSQMLSNAILSIREIIVMWNYLHPR